MCSAAEGPRALVLAATPGHTAERAYSFANSVIHYPGLKDAGHLLVSVGETVQDFHEIRKSMKSARHVRHLQNAEGPVDHIVVGVNEQKGADLPLSETDLSPLYERLQYASAGSVEGILAEYSESLDPALALGYLRVAVLLAAQRIIQEAGGNVKDILSEAQLEDALHTEGEEGFRKLAEQLRTAMEFRDRNRKGYGDTSIGRARAYLAQNFSDPNLMLQDAADEVHLSQSHFSTVFAQETGLTFTQYLTALRIGKAKEFLETTEMRSSQIATEVGYNDPHYFSYLFKKNTGMTPGEYRKNSRNE